MLFGREGIEHAAYRVHLFGNLGRRAPLSSFEKQMLDEMGNAVLVTGLMARAVFHPDSETYRTMIRHLLGNHSDAVVQDCLSEHREMVG